MPTRRTRSPGWCSTTTTSASGAPTARSRVRTRSRSTTRGAGSCASATCATTASPRARPRPACRPVPPRRSGSRSWTSRTRAGRAGASLPRTPRPPAPPRSSAAPVTWPATSRSADLHTLRPRHGHTPLVVMLVLTQLAIGAFVLAGGPAPRRRRRSRSGGHRRRRRAGGHALALVASLAHLGRPQYAWRAVLGLRHSWLSREIVAFGAFAPLGAWHAASVGGWLPTVAPTWLTGAAAQRRRRRRRGDVGHGLRRHGARRLAAHPRWRPASS